MVKYRRWCGVALAVVAAIGVAGCGGGDSARTDGDTTTVTVMTHDSWSAPDALIAGFEASTGYKLRFQSSGDAGEVTNKVVLTKDAPVADVVYGIDNTFATRAVDAGVLSAYVPGDLPASAAGFALEGDGADRLTPIDYGDVCVNIDDAWFADHGIAPPRSLDDLTKPAYRGLFVTPGAPTSSPGMAFLVATVGAFGENGWQDYWRALMRNGTKITSGWSDAYGVDFTAGEGNGTRPIVLSYASSPPFTIPKGGSRPTTSALLNTCFRQVEYAGVLEGSDNVAGAHAFIDFLVSREFQASLPENMYVFPVDDAVALPRLWERFAKVAPSPITVAPSTIAARRDEWLKAWADITSG